MGEQLSVADVLERAADLLTPEGEWTQGAYARDIFGVDLLGADDRLVVPPDATCFCIYGAVAFVEGQTIAESEAGRFLEQFNIGACDWNDDPERKQDEAVDLLRRVAVLARKRGK
jgi:hypothetical protein